MRTEPIDVLDSFQYPVPRLSSQLNYWAGIVYEYMYSLSCNVNGSGGQVDE